MSGLYLIHGGKSGETSHPIPSGALPRPQWVAHQEAVDRRRREERLVDQGFVTGSVFGIGVGTILGYGLYHLIINLPVML